MRATPAVLCASISLASLRASSTGCTSELKARLKTPSTRPSMRLSRLRRTLIAWLLFAGRGAARVAGKPARILREQDAVTDGEPGARGGREGETGEAQRQRPFTSGGMLRETVE